MCKTLHERPCVKILHIENGQAALYCCASVGRGGSLTVGERWPPISPAVPLPRSFQMTTRIPGPVSRACCAFLSASFRTMRAEGRGLRSRRETPKRVLGGTWGLASLVVALLLLGVVCPP